MNKHERIIKYFKNKSVFKFDVVENDDLLNVFDDIELILIVSKDNNYMDKIPMASIVMKDTSSFLKNVKMTQYFELSKLAKLKFLNKFRVYCKENNILESNYKDEMLVTVSNLQQQLQASIIEEHMEDIKEIISDTLNDNSFTLKCDDTPLIVIEFDQKMKKYITYQDLIQSNISNFIKNKLSIYTNQYDDLLKIDLKDKETSSINQ